MIDLFFQASGVVAWVALVVFGFLWANGAVWFERREDE